MHCLHCNRSYAEDANYCSHCGAKLDTQQLGDYIEGNPLSAAELNPSLREQAAAIEVVDSKPESSRGRVKSKVGIWIKISALLAFALTASGAVFLYYQYELNINNEVLKLQQDARTAALAGNYDDALAKLHVASAKRPQFNALQSDEDIVLHAIELEGLLNKAEEQIQAGAALEAEKQLDQARSKLTGRKEPVYSKLRGKLDELSVGLKVHKLSKEMYYATTIKQITEHLHAVSGLAGGEADALKDELQSKLIDLSTKEANDFLKKKNYTKASAIVEQALALVIGSPELLSLQDKIRQEQAKYEREEQQRIEQAMQKAAEEDLINQTAAVEVVKIDRMLDEEGNLVIEGFLRNAATKPIHSVEVEYSIYDASGKKVSSGTASASPDYIEAGESMKFYTTVYGVFVDDCTVVIDHATWYLD